MKFKRNHNRYLIEEVHPYYILCKNLDKGWLESFTLGDLVLMGMEPVWDISWGPDPRREVAF